MKSNYETESYLRWGGSNAYQESMRRRLKYGKKEISQAMSDMDHATNQVKNAMLEGLPPTSEKARTGAENHRLAISRWWYECSLEMHKHLGDMYVSDSRFAELYESRHAGLAEYIRAAIYANAEQ